MAKKSKATFQEAVKAGDLQTVTRLIREGADPSQADESGRTPLSWAVQYGNNSVALMLLEDPNLPLNSSDQLGRSPMHYAAAGGQADIMKVLLAEGADANLVDENGCTPLLYAAAASHSQCVQMLIKHKGVNVNHTDKGGHTALMLASSVGDATSVNALIGNGAIVDMCNEEGVTSLMMGCQNNHVDVVKALVAADALVDAENTQGKLASDLTGDEDIRRILDLKLSKSHIYKDRFSIMASQPAIEASYGLVEEAEDVIKGILVEMRFYSSKEQRDVVVERLRNLNPDFVANMPVTDWDAELGHYVFTDKKRHPTAPYCMVVLAGELFLEEVMSQASMMSFMEMIHIFRSMLECVEHLHLSNVVHCNLSAMSFMRFYDGIYRIVDVQDSRLGSEFYGLLNVDENALDSVPPELATCYLENEYKQPAKSSRDMWSLGGIVLSMVTGSTLIDVLSDYFYQESKSQQSRGSGDGSLQMVPPLFDAQSILQMIAGLKQETVDFVCQSILEKSMRTYTIRFPDSKQEGFTQEAQQKYLSEMVQKSPAVARLVDMMTIMQGLLSVNPRARPTCTQALNYNIFKVGAGAPEIKSQELLKLQMSSAQAEAKQLALMEEIAGNLKVVLQDVGSGAGSSVGKNSTTRSRSVRS